MTRAEAAAEAAPIPRRTVREAFRAPFVIAFEAFEDLLAAFERLHNPRDCFEPLCVHCDAHRAAKVAKSETEDGL